MAEKRLVVLTDDNWRDYFAFIMPATIIDGLTIPANGIDRDGPEVNRLLAWVALQSGQSPDTRYEMSRHDAAVVLDLAAGRNSTLPT
jgi:hypothetical protein